MSEFFYNYTPAAIGLPDISSAKDLGAFINNIYTFSLAVVGVIIFVRFVWAGWLYFAASGNASKAGEANTMMKNAAIGAVILFSAVMILNIINPDLVNMEVMLKMPAQNAKPSASPNPLPVGDNSVNANQKNNTGANAIQITSLEPPEGKIGATVIINGKNFLASDTSVYFGGEDITEKVKFVSTEKITFVVPAGAELGDNEVGLDDGMDYDDMTFTVIK